MTFHHFVQLLTVFTNAMSSSNVSKHFGFVDVSSFHENSKCEEENFFILQYFHSSEEVPITLAVTVSLLASRPQSVFVMRIVFMGISGDSCCVINRTHDHKGLFSVRQCCFTLERICSQLFEFQSSRKFLFNINFAKCNHFRLSCPKNTKCYETNKYIFYNFIK